MYRSASQGSSELEFLSDSPLSDDPDPDPESRPQAPSPHTPDLDVLEGITSAVSSASPDPDRAGSTVRRQSPDTTPGQGTFQSAEREKDVLPLATKGSDREKSDAGSKLETVLDVTTEEEHEDKETAAAKNPSFDRIAEKLSESIVDDVLESSQLLGVRATVPTSTPKHTPPQVQSPPVPLSASAVSPDISAIEPAADDIMEKMDTSEGSADVTGDTEETVTALVSNEQDKTSTPDKQEEADVEDVMEIEPYSSASSGTDTKKPEVDATSGDQKRRGTTSSESSYDVDQLVSVTKVGSYIFLIAMSLSVICLRESCVV